MVYVRPSSILMFNARKKVVIAILRKVEAHKRENCEESYSATED